MLGAPVYSQQVGEKGHKYRIQYFTEQGHTSQSKIIATTPVPIPLVRERTSCLFFSQTNTNIHTHTHAYLYTFYLDLWASQVLAIALTTTGEIDTKRAIQETHVPCQFLSQSHHQLHTDLSFNISATWNSKILHKMNGWQPSAEASASQKKI